MPIPPNLKAWLEQHRQPEGKVCAYANVAKQLMWLSEGAWMQALRQGGPAEGVLPGSTTRCGIRSSATGWRRSRTWRRWRWRRAIRPQMIFQHYRELVRPADAETWFAITPASVEAAKAAREGGKEGQDRGAAEAGGMRLQQQVQIQDSTLALGSGEDHGNIGSVPSHLI